MNVEQGGRLNRANHTEEGRRKFFTRVMPIFALMLAVTAIVTGAMIELGYASTIASWGMLMFVFVLIVQVGVYLAAEFMRELWPFNMVFALIFAAVQGVVITPIIAQFLDSGMGVIIAQALLLTSVVFITFTAIPLVTRRDFSFLGNFLFIMLIGLIAVAFTEMLIGFPTTLSIIVSIVSIITFTLFILYDMSKILKNEWGAVSGAISLYIDFIVIFIRLLKLLAHVQD